MRTQAPPPPRTGLQRPSPAKGQRWYQPSRYLTRRAAALAATAALIVVMAVARLWHVYAGPITVQVAPLRANVPEQVFGLGTFGTGGESRITLEVGGMLAGRLRLGQSAEIILRSQPERHYTGHVARIGIPSDAVTAGRPVDVALDVPPPHIHPAEQAAVYISVGTLSRTVMVPPRAVTGLANNRGTVWTLEAGCLERRTVSFGPQLLDGALPVLAGLPAGASVVVGPTAELQAGRQAVAAQEPRR